MEKIVKYADGEIVYTDEAAAERVLQRLGGEKGEYVLEKRAGTRAWCVYERVNVEREFVRDGEKPQKYIEKNKQKNWIVKRQTVYNGYYIIFYKPLTLDNKKAWNASEELSKPATHLLTKTRVASKTAAVLREAHELPIALGSIVTKASDFEGDPKVYLRMKSLKEAIFGKNISQEVIAIMFVISILPMMMVSIEAGNAENNLVSILGQVASYGYILAMLILLITFAIDALSIENSTYGVNSSAYSGLAKLFKELERQRKIAPGSDEVTRLESDIIVLIDKLDVSEMAQMELRGINCLHDAYSGIKPLADKVQKKRLDLDQDNKEENADEDETEEEILDLRAQELTKLIKLAVEEAGVSDEIVSREESLSLEEM